MFHAAELFKVLLAEETNILGGMDKKELRTFRNMVVKTILATDLATGFEHVGNFKSHVQTGHSFDTDESKLLLMAILLKVADVSHPCKPWEIHVKWSDRISEEFHRLGDRETALGLPVSPLCDRTTFFLPKSQCDFVDFVVRPCVQVFGEYCKTDLWTDTMEENYARWAQMVKGRKREDEGKREEKEKEEKEKEEKKGIEESGEGAEKGVGKKKPTPELPNAGASGKVFPVEVP